MQAIDRFISKNAGKTFAILLLSALPAYFLNLGLLPLFADEPTRANVALEMILSGNYSVPTIGADYYYNKPPVYNWLLVFVYRLTGNFSELVTRLPAIVPLFLFAITIYFTVVYFLKDKRIALLSAMLSILNGRMLVYDSLLGHIDIFYSWLTFISFISIYYFYEKKQWLLLFLVSYIITAITFLSKGMPSIVFQGLTIISLCIYTRNFKKLFSWQHILSGMVCLLIIGLYFYNYSFHNPDLSGYIATIWDQSSQRTAASVGLWPSVKHILLFPFEYCGHLFPASLLLVFCFHKSFLTGLWRNSFLKFCSVTFLANIWIYWLSPETRPRYLLMLFPFLFIIWSHAYYTYREQLVKVNRVFETFLSVLCITVTIAIPFEFYFKDRFTVDNFDLKVLALGLMAGVISFLCLKLRLNKIIAFLALLIVLRLGFSWLVLPYRFQHQDGNYYKAASLEMGSLSKNLPFYLYQYHPQVENIPFHHKLIFYIQQSRMQQVKFTETDMVSGYYLTFDRSLLNPNAVLVKTYQNNLKLYRVK
ncbi:MAG TPA: hypothetical protein VF602_02925 [Pedobacter sp.]|jgi:4-amino-4-deoxy-L-arabinose transferase-like glycosyltransferase